MHTFNVSDRSVLMSMPRAAANATSSSSIARLDGWERTPSTMLAGLKKAIDFAPLALYLLICRCICCSTAWRFLKKRLGAAPAEQRKAAESCVELLARIHGWVSGAATPTGSVNALVLGSNGSGKTFMTMRLQVRCGGTP